MDSQPHANVIWPFRSWPDQGALGQELKWPYGRLMMVSNLIYMTVEYYMVS